MSSDDELATSVTYWVTKIGRDSKYVDLWVSRLKKFLVTAERNGQVFSVDDKKALALLFVRDTLAAGHAEGFEDRLASEPYFPRLQVSKRRLMAISRKPCDTACDAWDLPPLDVGVYRFFMDNFTNVMAFRRHVNGQRDNFGFAPALFAYYVLCSMNPGRAFPQVDLGSLMLNWEDKFINFSKWLDGKTTGFSDALAGWLIQKCAFASSSTDLARFLAHSPVLVYEMKVTEDLWSGAAGPFLGSEGHPVLKPLMLHSMVMVGVRDMGDGSPLRFLLQNSWTDAPAFIEVDADYLLHCRAGFLRFEKPDGGVAVVDWKPEVPVVLGRFVETVVDAREAQRLED